MPPPGKVSLPPIEPMFTIRPQPCARMPGRQSWLMRMRPKTFVSNCRRIDSSSIDSTAPDWL